MCTIYQLIATGRDDVVDASMRISSKQVYRTHEAATAARDEFAKRCTEGVFRNIRPDTLEVHVVELELED